MIHDELETRAEVCEECECLLRAMPLTCKLVMREKQIGPMPCPHALRDMLHDVDADCPHPDAAWAARWKAAEVLTSAEEPATQAAPAAEPVTPTANSSCAVKTAQREVDPEAIEKRHRERRSRRRGVSHKVFYVQGNPPGPVAPS